MQRAGVWRWVGPALAVVVLSSACGPPSTDVPIAARQLPPASQSPAAFSSPSARATAATQGEPLCNPAASDYQKQGKPTPGPCISINPEQQIQDNLRYLQRMQPGAVDVAALQAASADLKQAFAGLRSRGLYDVASARQAVGGYASLRQASVHAPLNERLSTRDATVIVVLEHGSGCLIGEHGPTASVVNILGHTMDGACEAVYGH